MSSPYAALMSINNRIEKVKDIGGQSTNFEDSLEVLNELRAYLEDILKSKQDSKYKKFKKTLMELGWSGKKKDDRYVVFAERIGTLEYLKENLVRDFGLKEEAIQSFSGSDSDVDQQHIIEDFGKEDSKVRILLCSDAGSQGVNLHYYCNRMFNYDIPWSLITLEQRNGRIDRYGQKHIPYIYYLVGKTDDEALRTDLHIINNLTKKEEEKHKTLGDIGSIMQLYNANEEANKVVEAIEKQDVDFLEELENFDYGAAFINDDDTTKVTITDNPFEKQLTIFNKDFSYYTALFNQLNGDNLIKSKDFTIFEQDEFLELNNTKELNKILYDLPPESKPKVKEFFKLTTNRDLVQESIENARKKTDEWAEFQILYDLHPAIKYYMTKLEASVPKNEALAAKLSTKLPQNSAWYILQGQVSNNLGQPVIADFFVVGVSENKVIKNLSILEFLETYKLQDELFNEQITTEELNALQESLPVAIDYAQHKHMQSLQGKLSSSMFEEMVKHEERVMKWQAASLEQLEVKFENTAETNFMKNKKEKELVEINSITAESSQYLNNVMRLADQEAYIKVMAVFFNA
jgi:hypothetical protein